MHVCENNNYIVSYSFHFTEANIKIFLLHKYVLAIYNIHQYITLMTFNNIIYIFLHINNVHCNYKFIA